MHDCMRQEVFCCYHCLPSQKWSSSFKDQLSCDFSFTMHHAQVEARLRQLEGKMLASGAAQLGQRQNPPVYNPQAQGASAAIATTSKAYNTAADVTMNGALDKKDKVCCLCLMLSCHYLDFANPDVCGQMKAHGIQPSGNKLVCHQSCSASVARKSICDIWYLPSKTLLIGTCLYWPDSQD